MRLLFQILFCSLLYLACSAGESETGASSETSEVEIPEHLQDVENLTVLSTDAVPEYEIELVRETNYGDKFDDVVHLGSINDFAVDDKGRVYLADLHNDKIHVYNSDGTFMRSIGRAGRGPGEFLTTYGGLNIGVNDEFLFAFDETNSRISRFSLETFELTDIVNLDPNNWNHIEEIAGSRPFDLSFISDDNYLVNFTVADSTSSGPARTLRTGHQSFYQFSANFEPVSDKILEVDLPKIPYEIYQGSGRIYRFPFSNQNLTAFTRSGRIYKASSEEFFISIHEPDGSYLRSIYYPVEAVPFTDDDREKLVEESSSNIRGFSAFGVPDHWPVLNQITVDNENRLWVSIITEDHSTTEWWVLDENDNLIGTFSWPRDLMNQPGDDADNYIIKNGALYYLDWDMMNMDQQTVTMYRIEMNPMGSEQ